MSRDIANPHDSRKCQETTEASSVSASYELRISFTEIQSAIEEYLSVNDLRLLYICLDEWSSVPLSAQPYLAEYLKRTFMTSARIALKIAVLPFQVKFSVVLDGQQIGFERGGDIYAGLDLDAELVYSRHPVRAVSLLSKLLYQHLVFIADQLAPGSPSLFSDAAHARKLLLSDKAFKRLLIASQGNPRDFLTLFKHSYLQFHDSSAPEIGAPTVEAGAKVFGIEKLENLRSNEDAQRLLNRIIGEILQEHREGAFLVRARHASSEPLQYLIHQRLLHVWEKSYSAANFAGERFLMLSIDYCVIVEHLRSPIYRGILELPFTDEARTALEREKEEAALAQKLLNVDKPDKRAVRYVVLSDAAFGPRAHGRCPSCSEEYPEDHPVAQKARICPHCAQPLLFVQPPTRAL